MAAINKISANSPSRQHPSEIETSIAGALYDLETNIPDMKGALRPLQFVSAREVKLSILLSLPDIQSFSMTYKATARAPCQNAYGTHLAVG